MNQQKEPMNIPPKEFKIKLSFDDERRLRADFEEGGECRAIVSEPMTGNMTVDMHAQKNLRDTILGVILERFYPPLTPPYKHLPAEGGFASILDSEEYERRKIEHAQNFPRQASHE